jgi:hypothetical protein
VWLKVGSTFVFLFAFLFLNSFAILPLTRALVLNSNPGLPNAMRAEAGARAEGRPDG